MKTLRKRLIAGVALSVASGFVLAETIADSATVNDLKPYDNTVEWNGFWSTTGHVGTVVCEASAALAAAAGEQSVAMTDFDTRTRTTADGAATPISALPTGLMLLVR